MSDKFQILRDFKNEYGKPDKTIEEFAYELIEENKELKEDLENVLNQVLGAFERNDCIDWNFTDIREKYNFKGDK